MSIYERVDYIESTINKILAEGCKGEQIALMTVLCNVVLDCPNELMLESVDVEFSMEMEKEVD